MKNSHSGPFLCDYQNESNPSPHHEPPIHVTSLSFQRRAASHLPPYPHPLLQALRQPTEQRDRKWSRETRQPSTRLEPNPLTHTSARIHPNLREALFVFELVIARDAFLLQSQQIMLQTDRDIGLNRLKMLWISLQETFWPLNPRVVHSPPLAAEPSLFKISFLSAFTSNLVLL